MILEIGSSFFWKLELGFWNYTFIHLLGPMWLKSSLLDPRHWDHGTFWDFIILVDSSYDFGENEVLFVKIGARFWTCFVLVLDPKEEYNLLLITDWLVVCNMLHLHAAELNSCHRYNFMYQWVISYQGQRCWAEQVIAFGIDLNKILPDLLKLRIKVEKFDIQFSQHKYSSLAVNYALA